MSALLSIKQVAELLHISTKTLSRLVDAGQIRVHRIGHQLRFSLEDVQGYLASAKELRGQR